LHEAIKHWDGPGLEGWRPWTPIEVAAQLADVSLPGCVVGGWAIELAVGRSMRSHDDIEIAIPRSFFPRLRDHLAAFQLHVVGDREVRALPAHASPDADKHQNRALDRHANAWRMDVMLEPGDAATWVFRRDERIRAARSRIVAVRDGVPYLRAEAALLFKAKSPREEDTADFDACLPLLDRSSQTWLADALRLTYPGHAWIDHLVAEGTAAS
jgi:Aminoglycoside-2''-adenylyltransferase